MPRKTTKSNRGRAAAAENRQAILAAARQIFAERGYHVPLSAVAKEAGVGQAVLYRHFPSRLDLAFAVFESHWEEFEELATDDDPHAFFRMWRRLIELTIEERGFIEMFIDERRAHLDYDGGERMEGLLTGPLRRAIDASLVSPELTAADLMLGVRMVYGVVATSVDAAGLHASVTRALTVGARLPGIE